MSSDISHDEEIPQEIAQVSPATKESLSVVQVTNDTHHQHESERKTSKQTESSQNGQYKPESINENKGKGGANQAAGQKSQKQMTKAERRELQERQRAEKAARIAAGGPARRPPKPKQSGEAQTGTPVKKPQQSSQTAAATKKAPKPKLAVDNQTGLAVAIGSPNAPQGVITSGANVRVASDMRQDDPRKRSKAQKQQSVNRQMAQKPVFLFSHLPQYERPENMQARLKKQEDIHPLVFTLGLRFADFSIAGGNARCMAMLDAFKKVIADYETPAGMSLPRHLPSVIGKQVDFLSNTRVLSASMKTTVRELKKEISVIKVDTPDKDAKEHLLRYIDNFVVERIKAAASLITEEAMKQNIIQDGDIIMTYGKSSAVLRLLLEAFLVKKIKFKVIVVDGRPKLEGKEMLKVLCQAGIKCAYTFCTAAPLMMKDAHKVIIGASAVLGNGAILSRVGTAVVCNVAKERQVPVIALCESYKFSEEVRLDSFTWNEIGNPDELVDISSRSSSHRPQSASITNTGNENPGVLAPWRSIDDLKILNLHYDVTPADFITTLICEHGAVPSTCALTVLRFVAEKSI